MSDRGKSDDDIAREASIWSARMHGENAESWQTEFNAWLQGGPAYVKAYNEGEEIYIVSERAQRMHPEDTTDPSDRTQRRSSLSRVARTAWSPSMAGLPVSVSPCSMTFQLSSVPT